ncbi:MAG: glycosyltransferase family 39 protein [Schleiferiaceae bacterium]|nr:glycosyltransferase family 39 protein [Schleiferiaceae bacterium]
MNNLMLSIPTLLFCVTCFYVAWLLFTKAKLSAALLLLLVGGLALRAYTAADGFLHPWDERYHAVVAKNMLQEPFKPMLYKQPVLPYDYKDWTANHVWVHKQPMPLWLMAGSMRLFGVHEWAVRLPSILFSTLGIYLCFLMGRFFFTERIGFLAAFLFAINGLIIELTAGRVTTDHIDISFLFFIQLAIVFAIRFVQTEKTYFNALTGLAMGCAILSKWLPALIVLPIWFFLVWDTEKYSWKATVRHGLVVVFTGILVFLPWQIYIFSTFPLEAQWESQYNFKHLYEAVENHAGPFYYHLDRIRINYGELIYLPLVWFFWQAIKTPKNKKQWALLVWIAVPLLFFSLAKTKMQGYLLFVAPAFFIITAAFFSFLQQYKAHHKPKWLFNGVLVLLIVLPIRYSLERVKPFDQKNRYPSWAKAFRELNDKNIKHGVLLNCDKPIEAMFYSNVIAYPHLPGKEEIVHLLQANYTIIIDDDGALPSYIYTIEGLHIDNVSYRK